MTVDDMFPVGVDPNVTDGPQVIPVSPVWPVRATQRIGITNRGHAAMLSVDSGNYSEAFFTAAEQVDDARQVLQLTRRSGRMNFIVTSLTARMHAPLSAAWVEVTSDNFDGSSEAWSNAVATSNECAEPVARCERAQATGSTEAALGGTRAGFEFGWGGLTDKVFDLSSLPPHSFVSMAASVWVRGAGVVHISVDGQVLAAVSNVTAGACERQDVAFIVGHVSGSLRIRIAAEFAERRAGAGVLVDNVFIDVKLVPVDAVSPDPFALPFVEKCTDASDVFTCTVRDLAASSDYCIAATPFTVAGEGQATLIDVSTTPTSRAGPPVVAVVARTGGSVVLVWEAPLDTGGTEVLFFDTFVSVKGQSNFERAGGPVDGTARTRAIGSLLASTSYVFAVVAVTSAGSGIGGRASAVTDSASAPSAVGDIKALDVTGGAMTITFDAPLDTGGVSIFEYQVRVRGRVFVADDKTVAVTGLDPDTSYNVTVVALNTASTCVGSGALAWALVRTAAASVPSAPQDAALAEISRGGWLSGGTALLSWAEPFDDGGENVTGYVVLTGFLEGHMSVLGDPLSNDTRSAVVNRLLALRTHMVLVAAVNAVGQGPPSDELVFTMGVGNPPTAPRDLRATVVTGGAATLVWDHPLDEGGCARACLCACLCWLAGRVCE